MDEPNFITKFEMSQGDCCHEKCNTSTDIVIGSWCRNALSSLFKNIFTKRCIVMISHQDRKLRSLSTSQPKKKPSVYWIFFSLTKKKIEQSSLLTISLSLSSMNSYEWLNVWWLLGVWRRRDDGNQIVLWNTTPYELFNFCFQIWNEKCTFQRLNNIIVMIRNKTKSKIWYWEKYRFLQNIQSFRGVDLKDRHCSFLWSSFFFQRGGRLLLVLRPKREENIYIEIQILQEMKSLVSDECSSFVSCHKTLLLQIEANHNWKSDVVHNVVAIELEWSKLW